MASRGRLAGGAAIERPAPRDRRRDPRGRGAAPDGGHPRPPGGRRHHGPQHGRGAGRGRRRRGRTGQRLRGSISPGAGSRRRAGPGGRRRPECGACRAQSGRRRGRHLVPDSRSRAECHGRGQEPRRRQGCADRHRRTRRPGGGPRVDRAPAGGSRASPRPGTRAGVASPDERLAGRLAPRPPGPTGVLRAAFRMAPGWGTRPDVEWPGLAERQAPDARSGDATPPRPAGGDGSSGPRVGATSTRIPRRSRRARTTCRPPRGVPGQPW